MDRSGFEDFSVKSITSEEKWCSSTRSSPEEQRLAWENSASSSLVNLPALDLHAEATNQRDVASMTNSLLDLLQRDTRYGVPSATQIHESGGLVEAVDFPNNNKCLNISYDDRNTGRIGSISMNGNCVSFSYDGDKLSQISFSGVETKSPINFDPYNNPSAAIVDGRPVKLSNWQLGREISNYLR